MAYDNQDRARVTHGIKLVDRGWLALILVVGLVCGVLGYGVGWHHREIQMRVQVTEETMKGLLRMMTSAGGAGIHIDHSEPTVVRAGAQRRSNDER